MTAFMRKGVIVDGSPLAGIEKYDLTRLTGDQVMELQDLVRKSSARTVLTGADLSRLMKIRAAVTLPSSAPTPAAPAALGKASYQRLRSQIAALKEVLE